MMAVGVAAAMPVMVAAAMAAPPPPARSNTPLAQSALPNRFWCRCCCQPVAVLPCKARNARSGRCTAVAVQLQRRLLPPSTVAAIAVARWA